MNAQDNKNQHSILYINDDESETSSFKLKLGSHFDIITSNSFTQAQDILSINMKISAVLVDQSVHVAESIEFLENVMKEHPNVIRVIITDQFDERKAEMDVNRAHIYYYIKKPWTKKAVIKTINEACLIHDSNVKNQSLMLYLERSVEQQQSTINVFKKYIPKAVLQDILSSSTEEGLLGTNKVVAILFADIRKSVNLTEKLAPEVMLEVLNSFFNTMNQCVTAHSGVINKYLGDGILAIFGAPIASVNNPNNALSCAVDMIQALKKFNSQWKHKLDKELQIGIGIHSGKVIVGSVGAEDHYEYGVIGDTVNIASRLEGFTQDVPNSIVFSQSVYDEVTDHLVQMAVPMGDMKIRGKRKSIHVYMIKPREVV